MRFDWDDENIAHVAAHDLDPKTVEAVVLSGGFVTASIEGPRVMGHGHLNGRSYRVVFDRVGVAAVRVVTAFQIRRRRTT